MPIKILAVANNNPRHMVAFWKIGDKVAARPLSDKEKVDYYKTLGGNNVSVSREFVRRCEVVTFKEELQRGFESEVPTIVSECKSFLDKVDRMFLEFENGVQEFRAIPEGEETGERSVTS